MQLQFHCFGEVGNSGVVEGSLTLVLMLGLCSAVNKIISTCIIKIMHCIHKMLFLTSMSCSPNSLMIN